MKVFLILFLTVNSISAQITDSLFLKSSFNSSVIVNKDIIWNHHLDGTDSVTGYTFPDDLPGLDAEHFFNYVVNDLDNYSDYANAEVVNTTGYDGEPTNALYLEFIKDDTTHPAYSRVQYAINGDESSSDPVHRLNKGYIKYKIKMHFLKDTNAVDWSLPVEWKDVEDDGFRMGFYIYDSNGDSPYYVAKGQYMIDGGLGEDVWQFNNFDFPVIEDEWFELEVYWYGHPDPEIGKLKIAINGEVIFDITNQTKDPDQPDKLFYFMPFKIYGNVGQSWITDFEYWSDPPADSFEFSNYSSLNQNSLIIYPNPVKEKIFIANEFLNMPFFLTESTGKTVKKGIVNTTEIDLSKLDAGLYYITIIDKEKNWTAKIIKE